MAINHIKNNPYTMGPAIALLVLTAVAAAVLVPLTFNGMLKNWMSQPILGQARWKWLAGGAIASTVLASVFFGLSFRPKARSEDPKGGAPATIDIVIADEPAHVLTKSQVFPEGSPAVSDQPTSSETLPVPDRVPQSATEEPLPAGWVVAYETEDGRVRYLHEATGTYSWERPTGSPQPTSQAFFVEFQESQGDSFAAFADAFEPNDATQQEANETDLDGMAVPNGADAQPVDAQASVLPPGWKAMEDAATGMLVYVNAETGETQWHPPTDDHLP